jgi:TolB-like protein
MSFFEELKRRNVFRVGVAYVVASWLLLQITDVLVSLMGLPEFAGKLVVMLVAIGFIPVMIFSWAYEVTPEGIKRESEVERSESVTRETATRLNRITIGLLIAVAALVLVDRFMPGQPGDEPESTANVSAETPRDATGDPSTAVVEEIAAAAVTTPSVAVLPFVNMSADEENEYFSDGISEELLNLLVRIEGLRVPSRTSSFAFKGQNMDIRDIAKQLEVGHVLEGSVRKAGNRVRITAQLIDVTTDTHMWSDTYDRELEDIFRSQANREHGGLQFLPPGSVPISPARRQYPDRCGNIPAQISRTRPRICRVLGRPGADLLRSAELHGYFNGAD